MNFFFNGEEKIQPQLTNSSSAVTFTLDSLTQYNGKNGQPAYIAVDGIVYDVSAEFKNGSHHGYSAGTDLSEAFHRQHTESYLQAIPIVDTLQEN